ncbi:MAG: DUF3833 domain-containing protein [Pseudomonadota bacterium]
MDIAAYILLGVALTALGVFFARRLIGFTAQTPEDYAGLGPEFDIRQHLNGPLLCEGVIYGPTGRVTSRFTADFEASWDGNKGTMAEDFAYDSGAVQKREWRLTIGDGGRIIAEADDVVGQGEGSQTGASVLLRYNIRLPEESGGHVLSATDWMYLVGDGVIINRSQFRKFGIKVAELVATIRPNPAMQVTEDDRRDAA